MHPLLIKTTSLSVQTEYFLFYLIVLRCRLMHLIIQSCLLKSFAKALILLTQITTATLQLIWNCKNPFNSPDVEEIHNFFISSVSGPDCIPLVILKNCETELSWILAEYISMCLKELCFPYCWKVSSMVSFWKNIGCGFNYL